MGGNESKQKRPFSKYPYAVAYEEEHPLLGNITHLRRLYHYGEDALQDEPLPNLIFKTYKYSSEVEYSGELKKLKSRKNLVMRKKNNSSSLNNIIKIIDIEEGRKNDLCGITYYIHCLIEGFNESLGEVISNKRKQQGTFSEGEVIELLKSFCNGMLGFGDHDIRVYFISKDSIVKIDHYFDGKNEHWANSFNYTYKMLDTTLVKEMAPYPKILNHIPISNGTYLSPQLIEELLKKNPFPEVTLKSDIFTMAVVTLQMCCLQSMDAYYNYDKVTLDHSGLISRVKSLSQYSQELKDILISMLEIVEDERISLLALKQKVYSLGKDNRNFQDNKSTTDFNLSRGAGYFGNSNITQRTTTKETGHNQTRQSDVSKPIKTQNHEQEVQAVFNNNQPVSAKLTNYNTSMPILTKPNTVRGLKNSTQFQQNQRKVKEKNFEDVFYYPPHIKEPSWQIPKQSYEQLHQNQIPTPRNELMPNRSQSYSVQSLSFLPSTVPSLVPSMVPSKLPSNLPSNLPAANLVPPQIIIPKRAPSPIKLIEDDFTNKTTKQLPQTPIATINNIPSSSMQNISKGSLSNIPVLPFGTDSCEDVNTSFKPQFQNKKQNADIYATDFYCTQKMPQVVNIKFYESPPSKTNDLSLSNESTPIRKIQGLQSNRYDSKQVTIRETEEENEAETEERTSNDYSSVQNQYEVPASTKVKTYGKHHFTNGAIYEGEFDSKGNFCGNGILYYPNGKVCYSGGWETNSFHSFGVLYNDKAIKSSSLKTNYQNFAMNDNNSWHHYEGEFDKDTKNGFGTMYMCNGDKFSGCFVKDAIEGYGTFTSAKGEKISGIWVQNALRKL